MNEYLKWETLNWDSEFFGCCVARLSINSTVTSQQAEHSLLAATNSNIKLMYVTTPASYSISHHLLERYNGCLVDLKTTYILPLEQYSFDTALTEYADSDISYCEYSDAFANDDLNRLAIAAGQHSRFAVDPRIPTEKFHKLYKIWINKCVSHEICDFVITAKDMSLSEQPITGFIAASINDNSGNIMLIGVAEEYRRRNIGKILVMRAFSEMHKRGATSCKVVTQKHNIPATSFYYRLGFRLHECINVYHFWLPSPSRTT